METNADNWLHHSFVANDAAFGTFALSDVILFGLPISSANLFFILSTICESNFMCEKHFMTWLRQTVTNARLSFVFKRTRKRLKPIEHVLLKFAWRRNYWPVNKDAVTVQRSDWPRAKWDHAYCDRTTDVLWQTLGLAAIFWSLVTEAKFGLPLSFSGIFKELRRVSRKKIGLN